MRARTLIVGLTVLALGLAATATGGPSAPSAIPGCAKASLNLVEEGKLSLATDNPAFDPWWSGGSKSKDWEINDPTTGKGYESAVAYGIAKRLGFTKAQVTWQAVPFLKSFAPGKKSFDFYIAQVSNKPERRKAVTFSASYYVVNQAVAALKSNPISKVRSLAGLEEVPPRSLGRDDELRLHRQVHQARPGASRVRLRQRRRDRGEDQADRRDGARLPEHGIRDERSDPGIDGCRADCRLRASRNTSASSSRRAIRWSAASTRQ